MKDTQAGNGFTYVDRRTRKRDPWEDLPIPQPRKAIQAAQAPVEATVTDAVVYEAQRGKEEPSFDLSPWQRPFGTFLLKHAAQKEAADWLKEFKSVLPGLAGKASLMKIGERPVATFRRDGRLSLSRLAKEQPEIIARYTRMVTQPVFDEDTFREEMPLMHAAYRGRSFRLVTVNGGPAKLLLAQPNTEE